MFFRRRPSTLVATLRHSNLMNYCGRCVSPEPTENCYEPVPQRIIEGVQWWRDRNGDGGNLNDVAPSLSKVASLKSICLSGNSVTDETLTGLRHLPNIEAFQLIRSSVTAAGPESVSHLLRLKHLSIIDSKIGDEGIRHIAQLKSVESLDLYNASITDVALQTIGTLPRLRTLGFNSESITDEGIHSLTNIRRLEHLRLSGTRLSDAAVAELVFLPNL
jgi:Leucine-rich repeat (LRR) protein